MKKNLQIDCQGMSDTGKERPRNDDHFFVGQFTKSLVVNESNLSIADHSNVMGDIQGQVLAVADGMGGHTAGDEASATALNTLIRYLLNAMPSYVGMEDSFKAHLVSNLKAALRKANENILAQAAQKGRDTVMGSTLTMAYVLWPSAYIVHVGDSRCYLYRDNRLLQVTRDHTMAREMVDKGTLDPREADTSIWSHRLTQALGGKADSAVSPEVYGLTLEPGDGLLLCTDGLYNMVSYEEMESLLKERTPMKTTCASLIEAANVAGGRDNITVVLGGFHEDSATPARVERNPVRKKRKAALSTKRNKPTAEEPVPPTKAATTVTENAMSPSTLSETGALL